MGVDKDLLVMVKSSGFGEGESDLSEEAVFL